MASVSNFWKWEPKTLLKFYGHKVYQFLKITVVLSLMYILCICPYFTMAPSLSYH